MALATPASFLALRTSSDTCFLFLLLTASQWIPFIYAVPSPSPYQILVLLGVFYIQLYIPYYLYTVKPALDLH
jgi:hypothetical protein